MANKTGYMDKERAQSEEYAKAHLDWLKKAQAKSATVRKEFVASNREYAKTLGKFDEYRNFVRKWKPYPKAFCRGLAKDNESVKVEQVKYAPSQHE